MASKDAFVPLTEDEIDSIGEREMNEDEAAEALVKRFSDSELRGAATFEDALALAESTYGEIVDASDVIGSGFAMLDDKDMLVKQTFLILSFSFHQGDYNRKDTGQPGYFVSALVVTSRNERFVIVDGGAGIYAQLDDFFVRTNRAGGLLVPNGLRKSEYRVEIDGVEQPATTYYLNV